MNEWMNKNEYEYDTNMNMIMTMAINISNIEMNILQSSGDTNNQEHAVYTVYLLIDFFSYIKCSTSTMMYHVYLPCECR